MLTLGPVICIYIDQMITKTIGFIYLSLIIRSLDSDINKCLLTLTLFTLSGFDFNKFTVHAKISDVAGPFPLNIFSKNMRKLNFYIYFFKEFINKLWRFFLILSKKIQLILTEKI